MKTTLEIGNRVFEADLNSPIDISIPLNFNGPQPNAFGVEPATSTACEYGPLVGDTRRGGSCNFERVTFIPHCNGTHTECVGHITNERISILDCLKETLISAMLISVGPEFFGDDLVISEVQIDNALRDAQTGGGDFSNNALVIRTLPNDTSKLSRTYDSDFIPPYFTEAAMRLIVELGVRHLLVDLPSIDRLFDEGKLLNHRISWNVAVEKFEINKDTRVQSTITELIYVPNEISDGEYLLNLQVAPFASDATPSRPLLFREQTN
jgi:hypothetical protein